MNECMIEDQHKTMLSSKQFSSASSSSCSCIARTLRGGGWSMSSVMTALPKSASIICNHASCNTVPFLITHTPSSHSHCYYLHDNNYATEFSLPRNPSSGIAHMYDDDSNNNTCFSDIDEWLEHANKFCKPSNSHTTHLTETDNLRRNSKQDLGISAICNTFLAAPEDELYNITLPSIREESPVFQGQTHLSCIYGASKPAASKERQPYEAKLWSEARRKKHELEREASSKAKHNELVNRMRRKEDAIDKWDLQQTTRAMDEMNKIQSKLERKQLMASARTQENMLSEGQGGEAKVELEETNYEKISTASNMRPKALRTLLGALAFHYAKSAVQECFRLSATKTSLPPYTLNRWIYA